MEVSAAQSVRYDFGRCTVEKVRKETYGGPMWGGFSGPRVEHRISIRVRQNDGGGDESIFTISSHGAEELVEKILDLLGPAELEEKQN